MSDFYSRVASASLIKESGETPATPNVFFGLNEEDLTVEFPVTPSMQVAADRVLNQRPIKNKIPAPKGSLKLNIEPKTFGHFINGCFGGVTSGRYLPITSESAAFTVGETVTGGTSSATGVVALDSNGEFLLLSSPSGTFVAGETITGGSSGSTATVSNYNSTVYGHVGTLPDSSFDTYTLQFNYADNAIRFMGCRFHSLDAVKQEDNVMTAGVKVITKSVFRHAKVTAITASGAGSKTITVDQTLGLVAGDSIKLYRDGTGFLDFSASSVKTHTVGTVPTALTFTVTNLQTAVAVGDLIMLAPQTASYTIGDEYTWIGGSKGQLGNTVATLATESMEDFTIVVNTDFEERHSAKGFNFENRFPTALIEKGTIGNGTFKSYYQDEGFMRLARLNTQQVFRIRSQGALITGTLYNELWFTFPHTQLKPYQTPIAQDAVVDEDIPFDFYKDTTTGYFARAVLINDVSSY